MEGIIIFVVAASAADAGINGLTVRVYIVIFRTQPG